MYRLPSYLMLDMISILTFVVSRSGPSLLEHLDTMPMADRKLNAPFMMPISEKYKDMGAVVVGKIESGRVKRGDSLMIMPNRNQVEVVAIYAESEEEVPSAMCGDNVRFRLRGIDDEDINVGFVLSDVKKPVHAVQAFEAQLIILEHKNIICAGYSAVMHVHTASEEITLSVSICKHVLKPSPFLTALYRLFYITSTRRQAGSQSGRLSLPRRVSPFYR
jgi:translation elongation factor EF-1alpha